MVAKTIIVLDPTAQPSVQGIRMAPMFHDGNGKTIGILWNSKPNGDILLRRIEENLSRRFHLAGTHWHEKLNAGVQANPDALDELARTSDLVITATGDWGSCTTWCIHDSVELQKRGKPTITIVSDRFEALARLTAKNLGMPDIPVVIIAHPVGGLKKDEVIAKTDIILENVIKLMS